MSGWLSRAKEALSGRAVEIAPEPIELACPCGRKVEAVRRASFQRVLCKGCGEPFFLLPIDVYPRPVLKRVRQAKPAKASPVAKSATTPKGSTAAEAAMPRAAIDLMAPIRRVAQAARKQITPLRVIVVCLVSVLGLTGWWQLHRAARSRAEVDFKAAVEAGEAALQKKDLVNALQEFGRAASAADVLQRRDAAAEQARQRQRELTAVTSLLSRSLPEIMELARTTKQTAGPPAAESEFASIHAGRWLVLQTEVTLPRDNATPAWEQRIQVGEDVLLLTASLPAFQKIQPASASLPPAVPGNDAAPAVTVPSSDSGLREVIFAAQVESLRWDAAQSAWVLTLAPQSGFLWASFDLLVEAGLSPDELRTEDQLKQLLHEQSRWIGVTP